MVGATISAIMLLCAIPLLMLQEPGRTGRTLPQAALNLVSDLKSIALSRTGILGVLVCLAPVGAGAASNYFGPIADDWYTPLETVALVTGAISGIASAAGSMGGGWLADRMNRKLAYCVTGGLTTLSGVAMALMPHRQIWFVVFTLLYAVFLGAAFAAFTAFVLETIGGGAVATKYNIFASIANFAIKYMISLDGRLHTLYGANGMLYGDAVATFISIALLLTLVWLLRPRVRHRTSLA
jgi:Na+/melibiose symporter-like transporter